MSFPLLGHSTLLRSAFALAILALAGPATAAPLTYDNTFGTGGKAFANVIRGPSDDFGRAVVVQPDGKTVMAGSCQGGPHYGYCVVRFDAAGNLDPTFGRNGVVVSPLGGDDAIARAITLDGTRIVVAGSCGIGASRDFCVARYLADGTLDASFNATGVAVTAMGVAADDAWAVAMDGTRILVAGECEADGGTKFCLARYLANGTLDPGYGSAGKVIVSFRQSFALPTDSARALLVSDGKAFVAGGCATYGYRNFCVARFDAGGTLDVAFGDRGVATSDMGTGFASGIANALALSGSRILVVGPCSNGTNLDFCMLRVGAVDGAIDTTLAGIGYVKLALGAGDDVPTGVALSGSATILSGYCDAGGLKRFCLTAITEAGGLSAHFNGGAHLIDVFGTQGNYAYGLAVTGSLITLAGSCGPDFNYHDFCVARYSTSGQRDTSFNATGFRIFDAAVLGGMDMLATLLRQPDGKLLAAGDCFFSAMRLCLARFNADGTLDTGFADHGTLVPVFDPGEAGTAHAALDSQNRILLAGSCNGAATLCVTRYLPNGAKDTSWGVAGTSFVIMGTGISVGRVAGVVPTADGGVVAGAWCYFASGLSDFCWLKLDGTGNLDTSFGVSARAYAGLMPNGGASAMVATASGFLLAGSCTVNSNVSKFCAARVNAAGVLDPAFGAGTGKVAIAVGDSDSWVRAIALQGAKIVLGGACTVNGSGDFCLARLEADGTLDATFSGDGMATVALGAYFDELYTILADGSAIIAGGSCSRNSVGSEFDLCLARVLADGSLDPAFNDGGTYVARLGPRTSSAKALLRDGNRLIAGAECSNDDGSGGDFCLASFVLLANDVPRAPSLDIALAGDARVTLWFSPPLDHGASPIAFYTATCGTRSVSGARSPLIVTNLDNGVTVGCTIVATNGSGVSPPSSPPVNVTPLKVVAVTLSTNINPVSAGVYVHLTGTVVGQAPTGTVEFRLGTNPVAVCQGYVSAGAATCITNQIPAGNHSVTAYYAGDTANEPGVSPPLALSVIAGGVDLSTGGPGPGQVTLTSSPAGISCGTYCVASFAPGTQVTITAVAQPGFALAGFGSSCDSMTLTGNQCTVTMNGPRFVTVFAYSLTEQFMLTVSKAGTGSGIVSSMPAGIQCGGTCTASFTSRTSVSLTPMPVAGSLFAGWGGACSGTGACAVTMDAARSVTATFNAITAPPRPQDMNGDGRSDILYRNGTTGEIYRMLMNGFAISDARPAYREPNTTWKVVGDADFSGDRVADLLWRNDSSGKVHMMPFGASGMPGAGASFYTEPRPEWKIVHTPDLDGDGKADILWWNSTTGQVFAQLMNGSTIVAQGMVYTEPDTRWTIEAVGDFAGSGRSNQLLWRHSDSGEVYLMTIAVSAGTFSQTGQVIYREPKLEWKILGAADFNGDGRSDILWRNAVTGELVVMLMNGGSIASQAHVYREPNLAWKVVAQGDYDGDGKADILYRNETTGELYMLLMNGLAIAAAQSVYTEPNLAWKVLGPYEYNH